MYKRRPFSTKEADAGTKIRQQLEQAEQIIKKIGPCRERSLALTKLDEALLWANAAIAEAGVADYEQ
nr:MAG TPA: hypothetical protein [Caudoviricetes sp.]